MKDDLLPEDLNDKVSSYCNVLRKIEPKIIQIEGVKLGNDRKEKVIKISCVMQPLNYQSKEYREFGTADYLGILECVMRKCKNDLGIKERVDLYHHGSRFDTRSLRVNLNKKKVERFLNEYQQK